MTEPHAATTQPGTWHQERRLVMAVVFAAILLRSFVFLWWEQAYFDSDQAIVGLMAKHLSEGRAFPLFYYGQNYMLAVQAWLAAPVFLMLGPTILALRLPLVAINLLVAWLLTRVFEDEMGLRPALAGLAASFFVMAPVGTAAQLLSALGASVEPFLYVVLIWLLRDRPWWQGLVLGVGFLHREFTAYGFVALLATTALDRTLFSRKRLTGAVIAVAVAVMVWGAVWLIRPWASAAGPGTSAAEVFGNTSNIQGLVDRVCGEPRLIARGFGTLFGSYLGLPLGLTPAELVDFHVASEMTQGAPWLWAIFGAGCVAGLFRVGWLVVRGGFVRSMRAVAPAAYVLLVGLITAVAYNIGRCGDLHILTIRYSLMSILAPVGLAATWLRLESWAWVRRCVVAVLVAWAGYAALGHVALIHEYVRRTPPNYRRVLADYLVDHHIEYVTTDYWTAYHVAFLSREKVIATPDSVWRILPYRRDVEAHPSLMRIVSRRRCTTPGVEVIKGIYWVCNP
jgi:hypothetical protein